MKKSAKLLPPSDHFKDITLQLFFIISFVVVKLAFFCEESVSFCVGLGCAAVIILL